MRDKVEEVERRTFDYYRLKSFIKRRFTDSTIDKVLETLEGAEDCLNGAMYNL